MSSLVVTQPRLRVVGGLCIALGLVACDPAPPPKKQDAEASSTKSDPKSAAAGSKADAADTKVADGKACPSYAELDPSTLAALPAGKYVAVLDQVWRRVLEKYYEPTIGCLDWPALRTEYATQVAAAESQTDAYRIMNDMLGRLQQSHFQLHAPGPGDEDAQGPASPELQIRYIDEKLLVVSSDVRGVSTGAALVAVDGRGVQTVIERARVKSDRPAELAFHAARGAAAWVSCGGAGEQHTLSLEAPSGKVADTKVTCKRPEGELITLGNLANVPTRVDHHMVADTPIGVLAFNVWMLPMLPRIKNALMDLRDQGMKALVLDLRGNPGGVGPMAVSVARLLLQKEQSLGKLQYRKFAQDFNVVPDAGAFDGPIVVLVDEGTASTSEIFAAGMRDIDRITVVGAGPSAGAALPSIIEELEGGAVLQYAVGDYHSPNGTLVEGKGVVPDIVVDENREDFAAGKDPVLEAAVKHLTANMPSD